MVAAELTVTDILFWVLLLGAAIFLENRIGVRKRVHILWHRIANSESFFKVTAAYESSMGFENVADELKSVLRERYADIEVIADKKQTLTVEVDDTYLFTLEAEDRLQVETSKITSTMRSMRTDLGDVLHVLGHWEKRNRNQVKNTDDTFADASFAAELFLPYDTTFVNVYLPRGMSISEYNLVLDYPDYEATLRDTGESLTIETMHRNDLETILNRLLRMWTIWWHRLR